MNELKQLVNDIMHERSGSVPVREKVYQPFDQETQTIFNSQDQSMRISNISNEKIQDTEIFEEESLSLEEKEKELILKALEKNHGKRKLAAHELGISERTLYRKIKEYDLTDK